MPADLFVVPFTFVWCGMASSIFWQGGWTFLDQPFPFMLIPFVFIAVGFFASIGRFVLDMWLRGRTRYTITDRRIIIERDAPLARSTILTFAQLGDVRLRSGRGGRGTIAFGDAPSLFGQRGIGSMVPSLNPTPQLLAIKDVAAVFAMIQRLIDAAASREVRYNAFS